MADSSQILSRLRAPNGPAAGLAALIVTDVLARPLGEIVDPLVVAGAVRDVLVAWTASDAAAQRIVERIQKRNAALAAAGRPVGAIVPPPLADGLRALARLPTTPSHDALLKLLDRPPVKRLLRAQVIETLAAFGRRAASPVADSSLARGLGGISKRALGQIASGPGAISRVANAVSGEVERQVEKRAAEFADTAVAGILAGIAGQATDATWREEQAAIRVAIVDGLLEMCWADLVAFAPGDAPSQVDAVRVALAAWARSADLLPTLEAAIRTAMDDDVRRPLGDLLADFALRDVVAIHATAWVERAVVHLIAGDAFAGWLAELLA